MMTSVTGPIAERIRHAGVLRRAILLVQPIQQFYLLSRLAAGRNNLEGRALSLFLAIDMKCWYLNR